MNDPSTDLDIPYDTTSVFLFMVLMYFFLHN